MGPFYWMVEKKCNVWNWSVLVGGAIMSSQMINDIAMNHMMMNIDGLCLFVFIKRNATCWLKNRNQLVIVNIPEW